MLFSAMQFTDSGRRAIARTSSTVDWVTPVTDALAMFRISDALAASMMQSVIGAAFTPGERCARTLLITVLARSRATRSAASFTGAQAPRPSVTIMRAAPDLMPTPPQDRHWPHPPDHPRRW